MASDWEGVSVGSGSVLTVSPTWSRLDTLTNCRVAAINIERGRSDEFERTDTGHCTVLVNDFSNAIDITTLDDKPLAIAIRHPIDDEWWPLFRGTVDEVRSEYDQSEKVNRITIEGVDALDYLAGIQMLAGSAGFANAAANRQGYIFYEDTAGTVDDRIIALLDDAGWPALLRSIFTGNVSVQESVYSPGDSFLAAIMEACDAEFPTVANFYIDRRGIAQFHGRFARFDPDTVSATASNWIFTRWTAGDDAAVHTTPTRARLVPPFSVVRSHAMVRNHALAYPQNIDRLDLSAFLVEGGSGIPRSWSAENLIIKAGITTGNTAKEEALLYAQYIVDNYASLRNRVPQATIMSQAPNSLYGPATWDALCGWELSDALDLDITTGTAGVDEEYYIEGLHIDITPLGGDLDTHYPNITMTADLTPTAYWTTSPF